ncbi:MAG: hypothetical protein ACW99G_03170 [Candidatus Thorarchaeota archaeon]|jgi:hypothetical protein
MNFREYLQLFEANTVGKHNDGPSGGYFSSDQSGSEGIPGLQGHPLHLPSLDAGLPTVTKTSKIQLVERNKNPIHIYLADGTKLYFNWDEFKRIKGSEPKVGKMMTVVFQRTHGDTRNEPSQLQTVTVH